MKQLSNKYNLEERTAEFGESMIDFCKTIQQDTISRPLISQLVRSATSIGANYMEANGAMSKKDFYHKIHLCKKEAQETKHWLKMIERYNINNHEVIQKLWNEAQELTMIFQKISSSLKNH
jgi:four helix bundle protein